MSPPTPSNKADALQTINTHESIGLTRAFPALLLGTLCIALAPILVRMSEAGPTATAFWRCFLAVPFLVLFLRWGDVDTALSGWRPLLLAGLFFAADLACWHVSILWTTVANATLFANLAPFVVAGYVMLVRREKLGLPVLMALLLGAMGVALLVGQGVEIGGSRLRGDLLGILTGFWYGGYLLAVAVVRKKQPTRVVMAATSAITALALLPLALSFDEAMLPVSWNGWLVLILLGLVSQALGQGLIAYALAYLPVTIGALGLLMQPVAAGAIAWVLFGEHLTVMEQIGAALTLIAIGIARSRIRARPGPATT